VTAAPVTALWTALIAFWILLLMLRVVRLRWTRRVGIGDGGDKDLAKAIRVHGNAIETMPIALLLMFAYELGGGLPWLLHVCGSTLLASRVLHASGLTRTAGSSAGRMFGSILWATVLVVLATLIIARSF
jgi:uncharacterized membrane protein YecN with MAPEG domain